MGKTAKHQPQKANLRFAKVFYEVRAKYDLDVDDYCLLYSIHKTTGTKNAVFKRTDTELGKIFDRTRATIRIALNGLSDKGLIKESLQGITIPKDVKAELGGNGRFSIIDYDLKRHWDLGWNECCLLWSLFQLSKQHGFAFCSDKFLSETLLMPERTVKQAVKNLEANEAITRERGYKERKVIIESELRNVLMMIEKIHKKERFGEEWSVQRILEYIQERDG
jgi:DNA-binding MarR family transcriptional regulator